jgi:hypothetical protein
MDFKINNSDTTLIIAVMFICLGVAFIVFGYIQTEPNKLMAKDINTLLTNDIAMANYIQANSQTMEYLNKNCKQTNDTNETITLTCLKVKA